ncbi:MAG: FAD-dependent oxidoreductase [Acidimicrobiia bacterium]|nr:FAD-dependent oxidoreductase [Acidimicrobiia bacterium]
MNADSAHLHRSFWMESAPAAPLESLPGNQRTDVVVIGAGITGLTTAYLLAAAGVRVIVIEEGRICAGTTGFTTGKVTSQHNLFYGAMTKSHGLETAQVYAHAQQAAIEWIAGTAALDSIDCNIRRTTAYVYSESAGREDELSDELAAALKCGLPARAAGADIGLPWEVAAAVAFDNQIAFHPRRYCLGLADQIVRRGGLLVESTRAIAVDDSDRDGCIVTTDRGEVQANAVVMATQIPFLNRGLFFARTTPMRSYALAAPWKSPPDGMYISVDTPTRSIRSHVDSQGSVLIVGGGGHPTGREDDTRKQYEELQEFAAERFRMNAEWQWSAQDYVPADGLPMIGPITSGSSRIFVATGYAKWGMTNGTVAGMLISDAILGKDNPWRATFDSTRADVPRSLDTVISQVGETLKSVVGDRIEMLSAGHVEDLLPGKGAIVRVDGHAVAAYRDEDGSVQAVTARCTHLGCIVHFNDAERTWDCPCHGSRYTLDGHVIEGPATKDLTEVAVEPRI